MVSRFAVATAFSLTLFAAACTDTVPTAAPSRSALPAAGAVKLEAARMRPPKFNVITRVLSVAVASDGQSRVTAPVAGARVKLVLLPLKSGDPLAPNAERYFEPDSVGSVVTDSSGFVGFYNIDVTRFRLEVVPPAGAALQATSQEYAPPTGGSLHYDIPLRKR